MKHVVIASLMIFALACKVEKTGEDTYKVVSPTPEAKAAAQKAKEQAKVVGKELKQDAAVAAKELKQDAAVAAKKAGAALERAGEKAETETTTKTRAKRH